MCTSPNGQLSCSACGKRGVNSIDIGDPNLIEEVKENLSDVAIAAQKIQDTATFQIKHYKLTIKRMLAKIVQLSKDNAIYKKYVRSCVQCRVHFTVDVKCVVVSFTGKLRNSLREISQVACSQKPPNKGHSRFLSTAC